MMAEDQRNFDYGDASGRPPDNPPFGAAPPGGLGGSGHPAAPPGGPTAPPGNPGYPGDPGNPNYPGYAGGPGYDPAGSYQYPYPVAANGGWKALLRRPVVLLGLALALLLPISVGALFLLQSGADSNDANLETSDDALVPNLDLDLDLDLDSPTPEPVATPDADALLHQLAQLGFTPPATAPDPAAPAGPGNNSAAPPGAAPWTSFAQSGGVEQDPLPRTAAPAAAPSLIEIDVIYRLGPATWHRIQAHVMMQQLSIQPLSEWDASYSAGRLALAQGHLERAAAASSPVEQDLQNDALNLATRVREYVAMMLDGQRHLEDAYDLLAEMQRALDGNADGWYGLTEEERGQLNRIASDDLLQALFAFDRIMQTYGCSICGEVYRQPAEPGRPS